MLAHQNPAFFGAGVGSGAVCSSELQLLRTFEYGWEAQGWPHKPKRLCQNTTSKDSLLLCLRRILSNTETLASGALDSPLPLLQTRRLTPAGVRPRTRWPSRGPRVRASPCALLSWHRRRRGRDHA